MVGKGQRAGGMRGTRNPKKGNKIRETEWEEWGKKKKVKMECYLKERVEKHVGGPREVRDTRGN